MKLEENHDIDFIALTLKQNFSFKTETESALAEAFNKAEEEEESFYEEEDNYEDLSSQEDSDLEYQDGSAEVNSLKDIPITSQVPCYFLTI